MADVITRFKIDLSNYDANLRKAKSGTSGFAKQASADFARMGKSVQAAMGPLAAMTAAVAGAKKVVGDMVQMNREFEQSNANLAAVLGTTREGITDLTEDAKKLGASTMFTASQVTELQTELAKLGFNQQEIKSATGDVLNLAAATGTDLATAAAQAGATMRGFGLNASEMDRVASVLAVSTSKSALSMEKLGVALPIVQTTAAKTGFTLEDTAAMLGKLTDNGINAASAGTQLRKIMNDASTAGTKLANYLGGPVHSLDELQAALAKAAKNNMTHADSVALVNSKNATALDILRDMSVATDGETASVIKLRNELTGCSDELHDMVNVQMDTLEGSIKTMSSAWEGLMLSFSNSNGFLKSTTDMLADILQKWTKMRNINNGGNSAIAAFEKGEDKKAAKERYDLQKSRGYSDEQIKERVEQDKKIVEAKRDELQKTYDEWIKAVEEGDWRAKDEARKALASALGTSLQGKNENQEFYKKMAEYNDSLSTYDATIAMATKSPVYSSTKTEGDEDPVKIQRARLKQEESDLIASLDRMAMSQEEYEDKVYEIKRASLQKQQALYTQDQMQYFDIGASISNLDIQYQGKQYSRGQKQAKADAKAKAKADKLIPDYEEGSLADLKADLQSAQTLLESLTMGTEEWANAFQKVQIAAGLVKSAEEEINVTSKNTATGTADAWSAAASAVSSVGSALQSIEDPSAKVAGIVATAIASTALGFAQASTADAKFGTFAWIAASAAGLANMVSMIASIKSAVEYHADGGFIGGPRGTDVTPMWGTPGELVLNRAQQNNLAGQLQGSSSGMGNMTLRTEISGENLAIVLDNNNRRRGRGKSVR